MYTKNRLKKNHISKPFFSNVRNWFFFSFVALRDRVSWVVFLECWLVSTLCLALVFCLKCICWFFFINTAFALIFLNRHVLWKWEAFFVLVFFFCKKIFFYLYLLKTFCEIYIKCNSKIKFGAVSFCHFVLSHLGMLNSLLSSNAIRYWLLKIRDIFSLMIFQVYFSVKIWQLSSVRKRF